MYDDDDEALDALPSRLQRRARKPKTSKKKKTHRSSPDAPEPAQGAPTIGGTVLGVAAGGLAEVLTSSGDSLLCSVSAALRRSAERVDRRLLAVGDDVVVADDGSGHPTILRVAGRRTLLCRQDTHHRHREQIIVANVDTVGIVSSATDPPLRPRLIDRYLVALYRGGPRGLIVVNKVDEASPARRDALAAQLAPYSAAPLSLDVVWVSAETGEGVEALRARLEGQRCAFVGHSGVGKSSLAAALGAAAQAGGLAGHGRGRHTTSTSTLHRLPGGTELIDTPGIRQLGLLGLTVRQLRDAFVDLAAFADGCAYSTCTHAHEAGCAVQAAVDDGLVARARYDSYLGLLGQTAG